uniref:VWFA domain-containing protein n=1 Tax=Oryzias melastigma TaxID=30732 RepID=A0A3B3BEV1_ORYME
QTHFLLPCGDRKCRKQCENDLVGDIVFLVDSSGSIGSENFDLIKEFLKSIIKGLDIGPQKIRVGLAQYSRKFHPEFGLKDNEDKESLLNKVNQMYYRKGKTWTGEALDSIRTRYFTELEGSRAGERVPQIAVLITDGGSSDNVEEPAWRLRNHGVLVFCIGVEMKNQTNLSAAITSSKQPMLHDGIFQNINTCLYFPWRGGQVSLEPGTSSPSGTLMRESCAFSAACQQVPVDVFFLTSGFAGSSKRDFQKMKDLLKSVISMFTLGPDDVRVGVMQLGGNRGLEFGLNKYFSSEEMLGAVDRMQPVEGGNRLGRSLTEVSKYLEAAGGGRPGLKQSLVVITDLWSIDEVRGPASALRAREVEIYAVGVLEASRKQLLEISGSSDKVFHLEDFDGLPALGGPLALKLCGKGESFGTG